MAEFFQAVKDQTQMSGLCLEVNICGSFTGLNSAPEIPLPAPASLSISVIVFFQHHSAIVVQCGYD